MSLVKLARIICLSQGVQSCRSNYRDDWLVSKALEAAFLCTLVEDSELVAMAFAAKCGQFLNSMSREAIAVEVESSVEFVKRVQPMLDLIGQPDEETPTELSSEAIDAKVAELTAKIANELSETQAAMAAMKERYDAALKAQIADAKARKAAAKAAADQTKAPEPADAKE